MTEYFHKRTENLPFKRKRIFKQNQHFDDGKVSTQSNFTCFRIRNGCFNLNWYELIPKVIFFHKIFMLKGDFSPLSIQKELITVQARLAKRRAITVGSEPVITAQVGKVWFAGL